MTISAASLRKLAALNLDPSQMAGVLDMLAEQQEQEEARKEAQRERTRRSRAKRDGNVTDTSQSQAGNVEVSPKKETSPTPPKEKTTPSNTEPNGSSKTRAARLPADWVLPVAWRADALKVGLPEDRIDPEAAKMHNWSLSSPNGAKLNWRACWRNWAQGAAEKLPKARGSPPRKQFAENFGDFTNYVETRNAPEPRDDFEGPQRSIQHLSIVSTG